MYLYDIYQVKKTRNAYLVSVIGEEITIRITDNQVNAVNVEDDPEMVAVLLAIIELERINERAFKRSKVYLIKDEEILGKINYLIETRRTPIEDVITIFSQMKYFEMKKFFEDFEKKFFKRDDYI